MPATFSLLNRNRRAPARKGIIFSLAFAITALSFALAQGYNAYGLDQDIRKLNQFVQGSQNSPSMQVFREGRDLIEQERWPQAAEKFRTFVKQYPQDKNLDAALYWLAYALKKQGRFQEAAQHLDRLTKEFPRSSWTNEAEAMLTEIAPQLGNQRVIQEGLNNDNDEMKIVALQSLFEANPERAMNYVAEILKPGSKASKELKEAAVSLLGSHGGKQAIPLLLDIARNQTDPELRQTAIHRLGEEGGESVIDDLTKLYDAERNMEVKAGILHALGEIPGARAHGKLLNIARNSGEDPELRQAAIHYLSEYDVDSALEDLMKIYAAEHDTEIRGQILHALSEMDDPRALAQLLEIARHGDDVELRRMAIHRLGEKYSEPVVDELMKMYDAERDPEIRQQILHSFSEMSNPRARAKLLEVARGGGDTETRQFVIHLLGEQDDATTIETLIKLYDAEKSMEVKEALLHAFSESKQKSALRKLMDVARRDSSVELRKMAVHWLGESRDPEALKFLEDLLK
jgi:HEAT repeat protein